MRPQWRSPAEPKQFAAACRNHLSSKPSFRGDARSTVWVGAGVFWHPGTVCVLARQQVEDPLVGAHLGCVPLLFGKLRAGAEDLREVEAGKGRGTVRGGRRIDAQQCGGLGNLAGFNEGPTEQGGRGALGRGG